MSENSKYIEELIQNMGEVLQKGYERNENSVEPMSLAIMNALHKNKTLRLGQLIHCAIKKYNETHNTELDFFTIWDEELIKALREFK